MLQRRCVAPVKSLATPTASQAIRSLATKQPPEDSKHQQPASTSDTTNQTKPSEPAKVEPKKKTIAQLDEELRQKLSGMAGDGGAAGIEYEDGRPVDMKRSVRNNMFRYI